MTKTLGVLSAILLGCTPSVKTSSAPDVPPRESVSFPRAWQYPAGGQATFGEHAMVASNSPLATQAGVEILRQGGNAVDAAVAVGFALAVAYPEAGNIGGGGYMVIRLADGRVAALDYREMAPKAAFRDMYIDANGKLTKARLVGRAASGVPGAVAGLTTALAKYGSMSLAKVMAPAIRLAAQGFVVDSVFAKSIAGDDTLIGSFAGAKLFLPGGQPIQRGARLVQPELAATLRLIAKNGAQGFYRGRTAQLIADEMARGCPPGVAPRARAANACGIMTVEDLDAYRAVWREPLRTTYRGYSLISMPPSSSGGITVSETLNILEHFEKLPMFGTPEYFHLLASAYQRAFVDRNSKLGDPAYVSVPVEQLISKDYARQLQKNIALDRHTPTNELANGLREGTETTHYSVVDSKGNAVATTTTLNSLYGSGVYITGAGFFMNNEMDDFTSEPGKPNQFGLIQGESNAIAPGKRMLSAMSPTIVLDPRGDLLLVIGGRGGPRIITFVSQVILNVIEHHMTLADAMAAPRIHHQALPDTLKYERGGLDERTLDRLKEMGYSLATIGPVEGSEVAIMRVRNGYEGIVDRRKTGLALGY